MAQLKEGLVADEDRAGFEAIHLGSHAAAGDEQLLDSPDAILK